MNNKKIYTGALCLEDKKNCSALRAQRPWLTLRQGDQLFSLLTEVVAIPQVSLECSQLLGRFIRFCLLHPRRPRPGSSWFREETFPPLSTALYLRGWSPCGKRERERKESYSVVHAEHYYYTTLYSNVFFLCLVEKNYILFCRKAVAGLNKELQNKTLLHLAETDRLRHTEHQLHASESKVERLNSENIKLRLKIDDLRIKLQNRKLSIF